LRPDDVALHYHPPVDENLLPSATCLLPSAICLLPTFHQSVQPLAMGKSDRLSSPKTKTGSVVLSAAWTAEQRGEAAQQQQR